MATKEEVIDKVGEILSEYAADMNFARASDHAIRGEYLEAESLLLPHGHARMPDKARALDLLARIVANKGDKEAAKKYWLLALEKEPDNQIYKDAIEEIEKLINRRNSFKTSMVNLLVYTVNSIIVLVIILIILIPIFIYYYVKS